MARAVSWSGWRVTVVADGWIGIGERTRPGSAAPWWSRVLAAAPPLRSGCRRGGVAERSATLEGSGSSASLGRCRNELVTVVAEGWIGIRERRGPGFPEHGDRGIVLAPAFGRRWRASAR